MEYLSRIFPFIREREMMLLLGLNLSVMIFIHRYFGLDTLTSVAVGLVVIYAPLVIADRIRMHRSRKATRAMRANAVGLGRPHEWMAG